MTTKNYEEQFLALCQTHKSLRRVCPCIERLKPKRDGGATQAIWPCAMCEETQVHSNECSDCEGRGWLPLPEAERMGALVRVAGGCEVARSPHGWQASNVEGFFTTPEAALTAALTVADPGRIGAAQEEKP